MSMAISSPSTADGSRAERMNLPHWPGYELPPRTTMIIDTDSRVDDNPQAWQRELFVRVPYIQPGT